MKLKLPAGWSMRPAHEDDIPALAILDAAHTRDAVGQVLRTENEIRIEWKSPTFDPSTDSQLVINASGKIAGWCEVYAFAPFVRMQSRLRIDPKVEVSATAEVLIDWAKERAREAMQSAPDGVRVILTQAAYATHPQYAELLQAADFTYTRSFLRMRIEMESLPEDPHWPQGITVRPMVAGADDRAAVHALRDAFQDHWGYVETPFEEDLEEWQQWIHEDEDFDTDLWLLAMDGDEIAGFCQCYPIVGDDPRIGLVDELGVRRPWRGQGLATALLKHAFRTFYQRGKPVVELGVDAKSPTGATRLYEKAGMSVSWTNNIYEIEIRAA